MSWAALGSTAISLVASGISKHQDRKRQERLESQYLRQEEEERITNELAEKKATEEEIIKFCKETLAGFKVPKKIVFGELPKTSTGKIKKFELRKKAKEMD